MANRERHVEGYVVFTGTVEQEDDQFVAYCSELGVSSCGATVDEALDNLGDAIEVHLSALEEIGELERVFRERNIEIRIDPMPSDIVSVLVPPDKTFRAYPRRVPLAGVA